MKLVKYECGCIGFAPDGSEEGPVLIFTCDHDSDDNELFMGRRRGVDSKPHEEINALAVGDYMRRLGALIADGYKWRRFRSDLGLPMLDRAAKQLDELIDNLNRRGHD